VQAVTPLRGWMKVLSCGLAVLGACKSTELRPSSPAVSTVRIEHFNPPSGSAFIGPIQVTDGQGCGIFSEHGTLENARVRLQEAAVRQGADFVKLVKEIKPYSGRDCLHHEYTLEGLAYRVGPPRAASVPTVTPAPTVTPQAPTVTPQAPTVAPQAPTVGLAAPAVASAAPAVGLAAPSAAPASTPSAACNPLCSPGYVCSAGVCQAQCNPACGAGETCRADRVCVPSVRGTPGAQRN